MNKITIRALIDALATTLYIILIVSFIFSLQNPDTPDKGGILIPVAMLLLFVSSAAITGFLVFGKPIMLYLDGKKKEAVSLLGYTLGFMIMITILAFILMLSYFIFI
jgi:hypothetical protein